MGFIKVPLGDFSHSTERPFVHTRSTRGIQSSKEALCYIGFAILVAVVCGISIARVAHYLSSVGNGEVSAKGKDALTTAGGMKVRPEAGVIWRDLIVSSDLQTSLVSDPAGLLLSAFPGHSSANVLEEAIDDSEDSMGDDNGRRLNGNPVSFSSVSFYRVPSDATYTIVGWEPVVTTYKGVHVVHHINLLLCTEEVASQYRDAKMSVLAEVEGKSGVCSEWIAAYSMDGNGFRVPNDTGGFPFGHGTPYTHLMIAFHYLPPPEWLARQVAGNLDGFVDRSGFTLSLARVDNPAAAEQHRLGMIGMVSTTDLRVPAGQQAYRVTTSYQANVQLMPTATLAADIATSGRVRLVALGFHAHRYGHHLWLERWRNGTCSIIGDYRYNGYKDVKHRGQQLEALRSPLFLTAGDRLVLTCIYNTTSATHTVTSSDPSFSGEMCSFLGLYEPHQSGTDAVLVGVHVTELHADDGNARRTRCTP